MATPRPFLGYEESRNTPNIVVDGSPNEATVLTLTHWPGQWQPEGTQVDVARAGDFSTYRCRNAARTSMILGAFADPSRSPVAADLNGNMESDTALLYESVLPELGAMVTDPAPYRDLWAAEDAALSASEEAMTEGRVQITEQVDLDLAVVEVDNAEPDRMGHRFGHLQRGPLHPMAVHNSTDCSRILLAHRRRFLYIDRYETWIQLRSRTPPQRVDLGPLAAVLTRAESGATTWTAQPPSSLTPLLRSERDSSLDLEVVLAAVGGHLRTAPTAWDPFPS
ncbi:MAG: hypothetical protein GY713_08835 [Actinomycetia bacterium]|nr:hypothetical protein [Actinomycetes bacterium]